MNNGKTIPPIKSHGEYIKEVKSLLPKEALSPEPRKLYYVFGYFLILITSYLCFRSTSKIIFYFLISCLTTHCLSCIGFLAHELSHNSIIRNSKYRYPLEVLFWGSNCIPFCRPNKLSVYFSNFQHLYFYQPFFEYRKRRERSAIRNHHCRSAIHH